MILVKKYYLDLFVEQLQRQDCSENTISSYIRNVQDFIAFMEDKIGSFNPAEIMELDIKEYKNYLMNIKKQEPATINAKLTAIGKYCKHLEAAGILQSDPSRNIRMIKVQAAHTAPKTMDKNELYRLRREFYKGANKRDIAIFELLYNTGIRESELCHVELDDIDISERKGTLTIRAGKGNKYRQVPLNREARQALVEYLTVRPQTGYRTLFVGQRGPLTRTAIFKIVKKYARLAGLGDVSPHWLRHQFCRDLLASGEDITTVAILAGHNNINTTMRYTRPTEKEWAAAVEKLEE